MGTAQRAAAAVREFEAEADADADTAMFVARLLH